MKRTSYEIKREILNILKEQNLTYSQLERKIDTGFKTIKDSCKELKEYGLLEIKKIEKHESNGRPSYILSITSDGRKILEKK